MDRSDSESFDTNTGPNGNKPTGGGRGRTASSNDAALVSAMESQSFQQHQHHQHHQQQLQVGEAGSVVRGRASSTPAPMLPAPGGDASTSKTTAAGAAGDDESPAGVRSGMSVLGHCVANPRNIRSSNALRDLRDFFDM
jgi:hypothetical protein